MMNITMIAIDEPSPFNVAPGVVTCIIAPMGIHLIASLRGISNATVDTFQSGAMRGGFAMTADIPTALLVWRFDGTNPLVFDTAFNICKNPQGMWRTPEREPHEHLMLTATLQDEFGFVRGVRVTTLPPKLMAAIEAAAKRQVEAALFDMWTPADFATDAARLRHRWPTARDALRDAVRADLGA